MTHADAAALLGRAFDYLLLEAAKSRDAAVIMNYYRAGGIIYALGLDALVAQELSQ